MPTRPTKGDHGHADAGSKLSGNQKATYGSGVDPDVADAQTDAITAGEPTAEEADDRQ